MSILKLNETDAQELSSELRSDDSGHMRRRRGIVVLSMILHTRFVGSAASPDDKRLSECGTT